LGRLLRPCTPQGGCHDGIAIVVNQDHPFLSAHGHFGSTWCLGIWAFLLFFLLLAVPLLPLVPGLVLGLVLGIKSPRYNGRVQYLLSLLWRADTIWIADFLNSPSITSRLMSAARFPPRVVGTGENLQFWEVLFDSDPTGVVTYDPFYLRVYGLHIAGRDHNSLYGRFPAAWQEWRCHT
jgi:hypothetical protein